MTHRVFFDLTLFHPKICYTYTWNAHFTSEVLKMNWFPYRAKIQQKDGHLSFVVTPFPRFTWKSQEQLNEHSERMEQILNRYTGRPLTDSLTAELEAVVEDWILVLITEGVIASILPFGIAS